MNHRSGPKASQKVTADNRAVNERQTSYHAQKEAGQLCLLDDGGSLPHGNLPVSSTLEFGLLEQSVLYLRRSAGQVILSRPDGQVVGQARSVRGSWWTETIGNLTVHEELQEPLVMALQRQWLPWPSWRVLDAENYLVGILVGRQILDTWRKPLAGLHRSGKLSWKILDSAGHALALVGLTDEGLRLEFCPIVQADPFVKMLLLAVVLVRCC